MDPNTFTQKSAEGLQVAQHLKLKEITVEFSDDATEYLAEAGFDEVFGTRPLK